jgi:hypothetical protein
VKNGVERTRLSIHGFGHDVLANISSGTSGSVSKEAVNDIASSIEFRYVGNDK